jgi:hypothetical protein
VRTLRYRIDWESLVTAYRNSFTTVFDDAERYRAMSFDAHSMQREFSALDIVQKKLNEFLGGVITEKRTANAISVR